MSISWERISGTIRRRVRAEKGTVDAHVHLYTGADKLLTLGRECGIEHSVVFAFPRHVERGPGTHAMANRLVLEAARKHPVLYPFYYIWRDLKLPEIDSYRGVKWHDLGWVFEETNFESTMKGIEDRKLPMVMEDRFEVTAELRRRYPTICMIIPHMAAFNGGLRKVLNRFGEDPNVYLDTSLAPPRQVRRAIKKIGAERVIFGSDYSYGGISYELKKVMGLRLPEDERLAVLSGNILRLMGEI